MTNDFKELDSDWTELFDRNLEHIQRVIVACSGHLDSIVLFDLIYKFTKQRKNFSMAVVHVNYGLRGQDSKDDQDLISQLCKERNIPFFFKELAKEQIEQRRGQSFQEWARELRYQYFREFTKDGRTLVALAHHTDDVAETVLMRMARGSSPAKLSGMKELEPPFWRPLLKHNKADLQSYCRRHSLSFRFDQSNNDTQYTRNAIRLQVLPVLETLYPGATSRIARCAFDASDIAYHWKTNFQIIPQEDGSYQIDRSAFKGLANGAALELLTTLLEHAGFGHHQLSRSHLLDCVAVILLPTTPSKGERSFQIAGKAIVEIHDQFVRTRVMDDWVRQRASSNHRSFTHAWEFEARLAPNSDAVIDAPHPHNKLYLQNKSLHSVVIRLYRPSKKARLNIPESMQQPSTKQLLSQLGKIVADSNRWLAIDIDASFIGIWCGQKIWSIDHQGKLYPVQDCLLSIKSHEISSASGCSKP